MKDETIDCIENFENYYKYVCDGETIKMFTKEECGYIWFSSYSPYNELGYSASNINMCCNGKRKTANGYIWRFVDENNSCN